MLADKLRSRMLPDRMDTAVQTVPADNIHIPGELVVRKDIAADKLRSHMAVEAAGVSADFSALPGENHTHPDLCLLFVYYLHWVHYTHTVREQHLQHLRDIRKEQLLVEDILLLGGDTPPVEGTAVRSPDTFADTALRESADRSHTVRDMLPRPAARKHLLEHLQRIVRSPQPHPTGLFFPVHPLL